MRNKSSRCQFLPQSSLNQLGRMYFSAWVRMLSSRSTTASFQSPAGPTFDHFPWQLLWSIWATTERLGAKSRSWSQSRCQSNQIKPNQTKSQRAEPIESWIWNKAIFYSSFVIREISMAPILWNTCKLEKLFCSKHKIKIKILPS